MNRCAYCFRPRVGKYCSPECMFPDFTEDAIAKGWFPESAIEAVRQIAREGARQPITEEWPEFIEV